MTQLAILMIKTVVTTIDAMIGAVILFGKNNDRKMKTAYLVFMLANLAAMWM